MLRQAARVNSLTELALTKLDVMDDFDEIKICTDYRINGELVEGYPDRVEVLGAVEPVYTSLPGWKSSLRECRNESDLPVKAREFIDIIERNVRLPITIVGVGPERDEVIRRPERAGRS